jgi:hypothetical protein
VSRAECAHDVSLEQRDELPQTESVRRHAPPA